MPVPVIAPDPTWPTVAAADRAPEPYDPGAAAAAELDRQVRAHLDLGLAAVHGLSPADLVAAVAPLRAALAAGAAAGPSSVDPDDHVPFVLVLDGGTARANASVPALRRGTRPGVSVIDDDEMAGYRPLPDLDLPAEPYLLLDVDTGTEFCNTRPEDALTTVRSRGRTPLTVAEGIALVAVRPDMLRPNRCFSLMGSRAGNQRVPAVWISERRPKLGWCWDGNPHTWLGAASAGGRTAG
ncbi:DUF5701 family protein [Cellulomonas sp. GbtcB1]|uniref:DUF5701 family protein n=1 Tax=Cellulomonas sp. GbtcB1 TaxID=2824746 RepID=UPI001C3012E6|nr:DUF5701 family protein [Cellulomonas sp. GbtcB1]